MKNSQATALILAAGEGTRMRSAVPKVLHKVAGLPMLGHVVKATEGAGIARLGVVIGPDRRDVSDVVRALVPDMAVFTQQERRGTAHAVLAAEDLIEQAEGPLIVLFGDTPLVRPETIRALADAVAGGTNVVAVLGFRPADPSGYGRLVADDGGLAAIVEHKDATADQRQIGLCNAGLMALDGRRALGLLRRVTSANAQNEFYLTDVVAIARAEGGRVAVVEAPAAEVMGINDRVQLAEAEALMQSRLRQSAMRAGVTMTAPETVFLSHDTQFGRDVTLEPHVVFGPGVVVGDKVVIRAYSHLEGASVADEVQIGPFARLRPGTVAARGARIGNFVETKAASIGEGAKINHLSYVGDAVIGPKANIGAGTITCNYDGFRKHRTVIGAGAFIGSNAALVAPITVGEGAIVGAGSVIVRDVAAGDLAVARGAQSAKAGWAGRFRAAQKSR